MLEIERWGVIDLSYHLPELLAPAGSMDALVAAVENGADAVYLGGKAFGARAYAQNFDKEAIERAIDFCHIRGVKVYITVNTLVRDDEFDEALAYLSFLYESGADAVIVQDVGLAFRARPAFPEMEFHASTQMTAHSPSDLAFLQDLKFDRVILARELSLPEIVEMRRTSRLELEFFVHGALCVCYSGQCLMSSMISGRSGNRGRCAQPCRMTYELIGGDGTVLVDPAAAGRHLLSPRDLNLLDRLEDLMEAGVSSLKIEGRMKRPEYVAVVTSVYRRALDGLQDANARSGSVSDREREQLQKELIKIFNRGFTDAHLLGGRGRDLMSYKRPNNRGYLVGRVVGSHPKAGRMDIKLEDSLAVGDGIEVWVTRGGRLGRIVRVMFAGGKRVERAAAGDVVTLEVGEGSTRNVSPGDRVFKTSDAELLARARQTYTSPKSYRKIPVSVEAWAKPGEPFRLRLIDVDGYESYGQSDARCMEARTRPLDFETLRSQLERMGNVPFRIQDLTAEISPGVMVPFSEINKARRRAVESLERLRAESHRRKPVDWPVPDGSRSGWAGSGSTPEVSVESAEPELSVYVSNLNALEAAAEAGADIIYLGVERFRSDQEDFRMNSVERIKRASEICDRSGARLFIGLPRITRHEDFERFVRKPVETARSYGARGAMAANWGTFFELSRMAADWQDGFELRTDFGLNVLNSSTFAVAERYGARMVTLSPELTLEQIGRLVRMARSAGPGTAGTEVIVQGRTPVMVSEYCPVGSLLGGKTRDTVCTVPCAGREFGLKDRLSKVFPVAMDQFCRMHLFNSVDTCVIKNLPELVNLGISSVRVDVRTMNAEYVRALVPLYREALDLTRRSGTSSSTSRRSLEQFVERARKVLGDETTKGHYFRGVL